VRFPLSFLEISLWLAFNAIMLLVTSELLQDLHLQAFVDKRRLRLAALSLGIAFMATVALHALGI